MEEEEERALVPWSSRDRKLLRVPRAAGHHNLENGHTYHVMNKSTTDQPQQLLLFLLSVIPRIRRSATWRRKHTVTQARGRNTFKARRGGTQPSPPIAARQAGARAIANCQHLTLSSGRLLEVEATPKPEEVIAHRHGRIPICRELYLLTSLAIILMVQ